MKNLFLTLVLVAGSMPAFGGGIMLSDKYQGTYPLTGKRIELAMKGVQLGSHVDGYLTSIKAEESSLQVENLKLKILDYTTLETRFEIVNAQGTRVGLFVTEPPCTVAERGVLILNSGLNIPLQSVQN